jgi:hypothetical protein
VALGTDLFSVLPTSRILSPIDLTNAKEVSGFFDKVRVEQVVCGPSKVKIWLFYGHVWELAWDPKQIQWSNRKPFMATQPA